MKRRPSMERATRFELATPSLGSLYSTTELCPPVQKHRNITKDMQCQYFSIIIWRRGFKDSRGQGFKGFLLKTLSAPLPFFRFLRCLFLVYAINLFQLTTNQEMVHKFKDKHGRRIRLKDPGFFEVRCRFLGGRW
jgi:hypothetical protein